MAGYSRLTTVTLPQPAAMGIRDVIKANPDTFNKLGAFSVALFVLSLGSFFAITRTAVGGALRDECGVVGGV
jgi:hypothetical protein